MLWKSKKRRWMRKIQDKRRLCTIICRNLSQIFSQREHLPFEGVAFMEQNPLSWGLRYWSEIELEDSEITQTFVFGKTNSVCLTNWKHFVAQTQNLVRLEGWCLVVLLVSSSFWGPLHKKRVGPIPLWKSCYTRFTFI